MPRSSCRNARADRLADGPRRHGIRPAGSPTCRAKAPAKPASVAASASPRASLVVAVAVAGAVVVTRPAGAARITILDVGQGDAILVEGSRGGRLLIDGGPDPDRLLVELDRRIPPWDRRLDAVILSHPHEDHVAGLALLLERYRVDRVLEPGMRGPGPGYAAWLDRLARPDAPVRLSIAAGDRLSVDEIAMRVLWPIRGRVPSEPPDAGSGINNVSVVLLGVIGERRFLLAGDVEEDVDPSLLTDGLPRVDLLKVAHHGSRTATTDAFLAAVRPRVAVASAGAGNPYGHPARRTLERLAASGARVFRTDVDGTVTVTFDAERRVREHATAARGGDRHAGGHGRGQAAGRPATQLPLRCPRPGCGAGGRRRRLARPTTVPVDAAEGAARLGYHRVDDRSRARGCRGPALLPRSAALVRRARAGRGRGRRLPRGAHRRERDPRRPGGRGGGGAAPRRRQDPPGRGPDPPLEHGHGSAAWLTQRGHPELARAVAGHPVTRLADGEAHRRWAAFASREERIVAYADKRAGQRLESMDARFASWRRRYPDGWDDDDLAGCSRPGRAAGGRGLPGGRHRAGRGPAPGLDGRGAAPRARGPAAR